MNISTNEGRAIAQGMIKTAERGEFIASIQFLIKEQQWAYCLYSGPINITNVKPITSCTELEYEIRQRLHPRCQSEVMAVIENWIAELLVQFCELPPD